MPRVTETVLEIDLEALEHNYRYLKSKIEPSTRFLAVVKAFAYGSDAQLIARKLESLGVDYFGVAYANEGVALRDAGITSPILVLHPQPVNFGTLIDRSLEPSLYSANVLQEFLKIAGQRRLSHYPVHIKFNTGLNRLGFSQVDFEAHAADLKGNDTVRVVSVFSHLAASEDLSEEAFTQMQMDEYLRMSNRAEELLGSRPFRHLLNTSGILNYPGAQFDMVRSGIGLYGYGNDARYDRELRPIATLKTIISQIHTVRSEESVGYNRAFKAATARITATLPVGHADGIGRQYGKGLSFVYVGAQRARIIGNVCMDMVMIDVTDINCREGDEVIVFGPGHSAELLAASAGTISYELLTAISQRVRRVVRGG